MKLISENHLQRNLGTSFKFYDNGSLKINFVQNVARNSKIIGYIS